MITARNPVHSVLFLVLAFFNVAGLVLLQAEFIAMLLVIVYVGAVMVLLPVRGDDARHQPETSCQQGSGQSSAMAVDRGLVQELRARSALVLIRG